MALRAGGRLAPAAFVALALALVCVDLFRAGMGFNPAIDQDYAEPPRTEAVRFLQRERPARMAATEQIAQNVLGFEFSLYEARGYDLPILQRYDRIWRREVTPQFESVAGGLANVALELREVTPSALRTLRLLGVTHVMSPSQVLQKPPARGLEPFPPLEVDGLNLAYDGPDARVYRVEGALPRAWVVGAQQVVGDGDAAREAVTTPGFDGRRVAVTERRLEGLPVGRGARGAGTARIESYEPERVVVRASSDERGLLVLGDNDFPGWKAKVDGREVPIERVNYLFRGVEIGAGSHRVEFSYEPLSWRIGWITSLLSLAALATAVLLAVMRRRRTPGHTI